MAPPPGLILPTQMSYTPGAGNPRDSALLAGQNMNIKQANLIASVGGKRRKTICRRIQSKCIRRKRTKRRRRKRKGKEGGGTVAVPQFHMPYTSQGGPGTNPNDQIANLSSTGMQSAAWSANDAKAAQLHGGGVSQRRQRRRISTHPPHHRIQSQRRRK